jgi:hypothetical protein
MNSQAPPIIGLWFGNFFEPFYSDKEAVQKGIAEIAQLGFNSINLDSKAWEDFFARYRGQPPSQYVAMQELMMHQALARGMTYSHLALYLCGDNLYPTIRDVPPVRGEESIRPNGQPMGTYKYWSPVAQATMVDHVRGLLKLYRGGMTRLPNSSRIVMQTMFEPIPKPSFDAEGRHHYLTWLEARYKSDVQLLNQRYHLSAGSFSDLKPNEYWLRPGELDWVNCARPTREDFDNHTPDFHRWIDNQTYLSDVLTDYLAAMKQHWREIEPDLFIEPVLHQWGYFFNPPGQGAWQTGLRALDVYRCAAHVDGVLYIAAPLNAENRPDAMALSVESAIMRCANEHRPFTAGLFLGRHVNGDIYRVVSPAEAIATYVAGGAKRLHGYGYSGLDDGGTLFRMDPIFKQSLRTGNQWMTQVIPLLQSPRAKETAILFPAEMSLYEPLEVDRDGRNRMDLLGWYSQFVDLGWHVDILHPSQIIRNGLTAYRHLVITHNSLYDMGENRPLEQAVREFVANGGTLLHGPHCQLAQNAFGIEERPIEFDCIDWTDQLIPHGWSTVSFPAALPIATYIQSGKCAIGQSNIGGGRAYSFGFQYGYAYSRLSMPVVPPRYGKREMHPVVLLEKTPVDALIGQLPILPIPAIKGVEFARFGDALIAVNHRSDPVEISRIRTRRALPQISSSSGSLAAHSATFLQLD